MNKKSLPLIIIILLCVLIFILLFLIFKKSENFSQLEKHNFKYDDNNKLKIYDECKFSGEGFDLNHELGECSIALQIVPLVKNVLEIGGGAGKVSHMINKILKERNLQKNHIVIEPGVDGNSPHKDKIYLNKKKFNDEYTVKKKLAEDLTSDDLDFVPDCLYVDCEGCLHKFFETDIGKYCLKNARYLVNENDSFVIKKKQQDLRDILTNYGFNKLAIGYGCNTGCETEVWYKDK